MMPIYNKLEQKNCEVIQIFVCLFDLQMWTGALMSSSLNRGSLEKKSFIVIFVKMNSKVLGTQDVNWYTAKKLNFEVRVFGDKFNMSCHA